VASAVPPLQQQTDTAKEPSPVVVVEVEVIILEELYSNVLRLDGPFVNLAAGLQLDGGCARATVRIHPKIIIIDLFKILINLRFKRKDYNLN
jgi:hypothetical protein